MKTYFNFKKIFFRFTVASMVFWFSFATSQNIYCQEGGFKYFKNYSHKEYDGGSQNWSVLQDKRGIIYIANANGLLEFDGASWRLINIPNSEVRSMAIDNNGTIYIGGNNEIGFLAPDSRGALLYKSLVDRLENNQKNFSYVWKTHSTEEGIYFFTSRFLFRWNNRQIKVWKPQNPENRFVASFICGGKLFIRQDKVGLKQIVKDQLTLVPDGETFAAKKIYMIAQYDSKKLLIGTRLEGFYIYDGIKVVPFPTEADDYLKEKHLYHGIRLLSTQGDFALATLRGGLVIIDSLGKLKQIFSKAHGLLDNGVKYIFEDFQGNLWLALDKGISKIEYTSPISIYDDRSNLPGSVLSVIRHGPNNDLHVGTADGLYYLSPANKFHLVPGMPVDCWSILSIGNSLLAATSEGVFQVGNKNNDIQTVIDNISFFLLRSKMDINRVWVGTTEGLYSLYLFKENQQWAKENEYKKINQEIRTIVESKKGNLWLGIRPEGVLKVDFLSAGTIVEPIVTRYNTSHGLPPGKVNVYMAAGHVMFATGKGIFRFDEKNKIFIPDYTLRNEFAGGSEGKDVRIVEDRHKNIWLHSERRNIQAIPMQKGNFTLNKNPFRRIPLSEVYAIYPDPNGDAVWLGGDEGLIRYDKKIKKNYDLDFLTIIRKVVANGNLIFDGYKGKYKYKMDDDSRPEYIFPIIDYRDRNLRFEFAAPFFEGESATKYQCLLEGYDDHWSDWNSEHQKEYTNLDSGTYTFRVRSKNIYDHLSGEAAFLFKVLPPWYKTWWAFLAYTFIFFLLMFLVVKWRSGKLKREKQKLEQIVKDRTKEIKEKNQQLEKQTFQLKDQSEKLKEMDKVKSRFFANISHEFRTPLTLLMGPLEQMIANCSDEKKEKKRRLNLMLRNAQRLLRLINQLLELSKLESGKLKLQAHKTNVIPFVKGITASFQFLAYQKELDLVFHAEEDVEDVVLYIDPRKMEDIMSNLLINAFKFTSPGGEVRVIVKRNPAAEANFPEGSVEISVCDTGHGIPAEQLAYIFDRFYQAETTYEYHQKGSGIGLALSKELVELHHGTIEARSSVGEGSAFIIQLPMGSTHLSPDEIAESGVPAEPNASAPVEGAPSLETVMEKEENDSEKKTEYDLEWETGDDKNIILVVEDSTDMRDYIRGALEPDYTVVDAEDGQGGIQKAQEIIPDLIISDIMMPEVDGYELCRVLKSDIQTSHIPIILLTAKASEENILHGLKNGADDYITKPFSTKILSARIKNLIDIRSQLQQNFKREMTFQPVKISVSKIDREFLQDLQDVIKKNISEPEFNVEAMCKRLYMSNATLYRKIQALCGQTPTEFLRSFRLKRAMELLKSGFGSVTEVAFEVGFSSRAYFTKCFKEKFHQLPSTYQESER
jgi:signal transduction histidine kinase/DNA-binding response OmpR family regulator